MVVGDSRFPVGSLVPKPSAVHRQPRIQGAARRPLSMRSQQDTSVARSPSRVRLSRLRNRHPGSRWFGRAMRRPQWRRWGDGHRRSPLCGTHPLRRRSTLRLGSEGSRSAAMPRNRSRGRWREGAHRGRSIQRSYAGSHSAAGCVVVPASAQLVSSRTHRQTIDPIRDCMAG